MNMADTQKVLSEKTASTLAAKFDALKLLNAKGAMPSRGRGRGTPLSTSSTLNGVGVVANAKSDEQTSVVEKEKKNQVNNVTKSVEPSKTQPSSKPKDPIGSSDSPDEDGITDAEKSLLQKVVRKGLVTSKYNIEVQQKNPSSPLYSVKTFEALHLKKELLKGIYSLGFSAPSKIQETALPTLLANPPQNMIAQSQSGTGKTATFVLTMLSRVDVSLSYPQAMCICPTLELAVQITEFASKMSKFCPEIKIVLAVRGEEASKTTLTHHIVIGTPGKLLDWSVRMRHFDLKKIKVFVLDEADIMINTQGYQDQSIRMIKGLSDSCQIMLFSATYERDLMKFAESVIPSPIIIKLRREEETLDNIKQFYVKTTDMEHKYKTIENLYSTLTIGQSMIFCQTKKTAEFLYNRMVEAGFSVGMLTGDLMVDERIKVLDRFRDAKYNSLITTNVLARGIDIESVSVVINFDIPVDRLGIPDQDTYLHRIGRTGRFGKDGIAINIVESDKDLQKLRLIENHFNVKIKKLNIEDLDEIEKETE